MRPLTSCHSRDSANGMRVHCMRLDARCPSSHARASSKGVWALSKRRPDQRSVRFGWMPPGADRSAVLASSFADTIRCVIVCTNIDNRRRPRSPFPALFVSASLCHRPIGIAPCMKLHCFDLKGSIPKHGFDGRNNRTASPQLLAGTRRVVSGQGFGCSYRPSSSRA
jgi:hypothetical protein